MNEEIEIAPPLFQRVKDRIDTREIRDVAGQDQIRADGFRQRCHALLQGVALVREGQFRTLFVRRLGDPPGNGTIVGNAHYEAALSLHQRCRLTHVSSSSSNY